MDRLFRQSGLMRDKWDAYRGTETYGALTISKAFSGMTSFYTPVRIPSASEDFGMARLAELDPMDAAKYPWNDIGSYGRKDCICQSPCGTLPTVTSTTATKWRCSSRTALLRTKLPRC